MSESLTGPLLSLLGEEKFIALVERFGGTRLYVPHTIPATHEIAKAIGEEAAARLSRRYAPAQLRVPLAREIRARHYRGQRGWSHARIARKLGLSETAIDKMFARMENKPEKAPAQLAMKFG